jgi:alpha-glucosidase
MKTNSFFLIFLFLIFSYSGMAQSGVGNITSSLKREQNLFSLSAENADVQLEFATADMVRIRTSWDRSFEEDEPYMVSRYSWAPVAVQATEDANSFLLSTSELNIRIQKAPFSLEITNLQGDVLLSDKPEGAAGGAYKNGEVVGSRKKMAPDEHFFGFGERMDFVDQRGKKLALNVGRGEGMPHITGAYNILEANYAPVTFFMSTRGYGIFLHNPYATRWDMGHTQGNTYSFEAAGGELDYYFIYGPDFPQILDLYTDLTGKSPLLPRFAHGLHVGTYSGGTWGHEALTSTQYVVALARRFREMGIPVDVFHLDSTWRMFGENGGKGATTFEWRETFKNPKTMFDSLYAMNLNMVGLHVRPRFDNGKTLRLLDGARSQGYVYPEENNPGEFVNFFDEKATDWWWDNGVMKVAALGARFLKTDEGSAFGRKANESDKVGPTGAEAQRLHNIFPIAYAKAPFERFSKYNGMRGMNHTREGYAGIQRYPFIWAGDWPSEWQYFAPVIRAGINIGLSGVGYWSHNMGGFEHDADPELYIRWVQFGMFSPVAHVFGMDHPGYKEPWNYGEQALQNFTKYDRLRYRLIPYLYSNAYTQHKTGLPIMRALVLEHQQDVNTYAIDDEYLFGSDMLVAPVTTKGAQTRVVYLPEGEWYHYWSCKAFGGRQYHSILTPLDELPLFVKAGAIIPMQDEVQYDNRQNWGDLTLEIFPGGSDTLALYEDDGLSEKYKDGFYSITNVISEVTDKERQIRLEKGSGNYQAPKRSYILKIHQEQAPASLQLNLNGKKKKLKQSDKAGLLAADATGWYYDQENKLLWIKSSKAANEALSIVVSQ